jgi:hypothetical protein
MVFNVDFGDIGGRDYGYCLLLWVFLYLIRGAMVLVSSPFLYWLGYKALTWREALIITHGGLRGAVSLALGLAVSLEDGPDGLPEFVRDRTLFYAGMLRQLVCYMKSWSRKSASSHNDMRVGGIAILTLLLNATTTPYVINHLGLTKEPAGQQRIFNRARKLLQKFVQKRAESLSRDKLFSMCNWDEVGDGTVCHGYLLLSVDS